MEKSRQTYEGFQIPLLGFGTYKNVDNPEAIAYALENGYRMIDTAWLYENEALVGKVIAQNIIPRQDLVVATKVWPNYFGQDLTRQSLDRSLRDLQVDYLDILYLHWPHYDWAVYEEAWSVLEKAKEQGLVKSIAVSNLNQEMLSRFSHFANIKPAMNQIEVHPFWPENDLIDYMEEEEILTVAYTPLARGEMGLFDQTSLQRIAKKYDKTPAQVVLRWHLERGTIILPKTVQKERVLENIDLFDFALEEEEMEAINLLAHPQGRIGHAPTDQTWLKSIARQAR